MQKADDKFWQRCTAETVANQYYLEQLLGSGAFGGVFRATQIIVGKKQQKRLAVKLMLSGEIQAKELEFAMNMPSHRNLVQHLAGNNTDIRGFPMFYLVMELADGTLADFVKTSGQIPSLQVKAIVKDIAQGLNHLHEINSGDSQDKKCVHRDLKLLNILRFGNTWKIADFGFAKALDNSTMQASQTAGGTLYYMPPEILRNGYVSTKWDVWSLGVMIVEMLTGHFPFYSSERDEVKHKLELERKIQRGDPDLSDIPKEWIDIVKGCLKRDYKQRWTISQVLTAIEKVGLSTIKTQIPLPATETQVYQSKTQRLPAQSSVFNNLLRKILKMDVSLLLVGIVTAFMIFVVVSVKKNTCFNIESDKQGQIQCYTEKINSDSSNAETYFRRGNARYEIGDKKGSIADYTEAIRLAGLHPYAYHHRGKAKLDLGDIQGAILDQDIALDQMPSLESAISIRLQAYQKLKNKLQPSALPKVVPDAP
jgi:serine/threonine protein kinase